MEPHGARQAADASDVDDDVAGATPPSVDIRSGSASDAAAAADGGAPAVAADASDAQPEPVAAPAPQITPATATSTNEPVDPPAAPALSPITAQNNDPPVAASGDTAKTRAQVRDELSKARNDGAMSRFGNPDPYGPGGAASRSPANPPSP
jgi:hypothetical protein